MSRLQELRGKYDAKTKEIEELEEEINYLDNTIDEWEPSEEEEEVECRYDAMLNEVHGEFLGMEASYILKECDPTTYRVGMADFSSGLNNEEFDDYLTLVSEKESLENDLEELREELAEIDEVIADQKDQLVTEDE